MKAWIGRFLADVLVPTLAEAIVERLGRRGAVARSGEGDEPTDRSERKGG
jgi:hypothetical protein